MLQASWGRRGKQQQKKKSPNLGTTILPAPVFPLLYMFNIAQPDPCFPMLAINCFPLFPYWFSWQRASILLWLASIHPCHSGTSVSCNPTPTHHLVMFLSVLRYCSMNHTHTHEWNPNKCCNLDIGCVSSPHSTILLYMKTLFAIRLCMIFGWPPLAKKPPSRQPPTPSASAAVCLKCTKM